MRRFLRRLAGDVSAVSLIEFAMCLPVLLVLSLYVVELANYMLVREQVSQLALQVSDNASRIGTQNTVQTVIDEQQVNDLFSGANLQGGGINMLKNGRMILSSLEVDPTAPNGQYIHWQRCYGNLAYASHYGVQGTGKGTTTLLGVGPPGALVQATATVPVMFVEIGYQYKPIVSAVWVPQQIISEVSALMVRDNRDISGTGINPVAGVTASTC
jgi:hypothetical protein